METNRVETKKTEIKRTESDLKLINMERTTWKGYSMRSLAL